MRDPIKLDNLVEKGNAIMEDVLATPPMVRSLVMKGNKQHAIQGLGEHGIGGISWGSQVNVAPSRGAESGGEHGIPLIEAGGIAIDQGRGVETSFLRLRRPSGTQVQPGCQLWWQRCWTQASWDGERT